nr:helix-turn-helix transcriptional regulator [Candidatus Sigynarchaeota archaeon]
MFSSGKEFQYKGRHIKLSAHEFITLLKIRASTVGISGYKLISDLAKQFAGSWAPQSGTIYPILRRLTDEKHLIDEKDEKTPLGPAVKVYKIKDDLGKTIDNVLLDNYQADITFFQNYVEFLFESIEQSVKSGLLEATIGTQVQAVLDELIKKLQAVHGKLGELQNVEPVPVPFKCKKCNEIIDREGNYCPKCGAELSPGEKKGSG